MELTINKLIKIILGVLVLVVVVVGISMFFKNYVVKFFKDIPTGEVIKLILSLIN